jgi:hypothetical protein
VFPQVVLVVALGEHTMSVVQEPPLIEDATTPTIFYDGLTRVEAIAGVMRMVAFIRRLNPATGEFERVAVATLIRPAGVTQEIRSAIRDAHGSEVLVQFAH